MKKLFHVISFLSVLLSTIFLFSCTPNSNSEGEQVSVTGVTVSPEGKILAAGDTFQLTATVSPSNASDKSVTWSSQKSEIASVDDKGLVTALSQGITAITATTSDGGFQGRCMITVNAASDPVVPVTEVSVSPATLTLAIGGKQTLQATVLPANATQMGVIWTSSDANVASVSDAGEVTALKAGTTTVKATAMDGSGKSGSCTVTVTEKAPSQTLKFRYFDDVTGNKDTKDAANGIELSYPTPPRVIFFVTEDGTNPISDAEASHYSVTKIEDAAGVLREESQRIFIDKLYGTSTGHYVFRLAKAGTAKVTLSYADGAGKKLTGTYAITYNESEHELEFLTGIGTRLINAHEPYSGPVEALVDETNKLYVVVHDKTVDKLLSTGEFVLDVAHNDPESVAQYEAAVVEESGVRKGFAIQFKSGGYAGIGLSYKDGDTKKLSAVLQVHVNSSLRLSKSATGDQAYLVDGAELALKVGTPQSVYFFNHELKRNEVVYASGLKLTGGDASIAAVELAKDGKSLVFTPKKVGTTTWKIAYSYKGFTIDETLKVTVAAATVPVTSLTWDSGNPKDLNIGQTITYKVAVNPSNATDQKVTWTSSDPAVAEITTQVGNMANVKGLSVGTTTITATCGGKSVSGQVTVTAYYQIRFKGDVLPSTISYDMGTAMGNWLTFTVYDRQQGKEISAASSGVKVTISNPSVAKVSAINASGIVLEALHRGTTMVVFSIGFQTLAATELKVNPLYGVFSALSQKSYNYNGQTEDYVLGYIKSNQLEYRLYDASANEFITVSSGLNCVVDNPAVVQATAVTVGGAQYWRASVMKSGTATISFIYNGVSIRTLKLNVVDPHPFVDLGLSVKWATMNIGASQPNYPGNVYAWGETSGKSNYSPSTYKWYNGSSYTKYTARDGKMILEKDDDVAQTFWGWGWRMPTRAEFDDLCSKCTWTQTTEGGVKVFKITGKNGNFILIPLAGSYNYNIPNSYGVSAVYWTSERLGGYEDSAITMVANTGSSKGTTGQVSPRYQGLYVRAVTDRY